MLEFATSSCVMFRSSRIVIVNWSSQRLRSREKGGVELTSGGKAYHDRNAIMKPSHEKKNTRPYLSAGLRMGTERALWLRGLSSGAWTRRRRMSSAMMALWKSR